MERLPVCLCLFKNGSSLYLFTFFEVKCAFIFIFSFVLALNLYLILTKDCFMFFNFNFFPITVYIQYYVVLVSDGKMGALFKNRLLTKQAG